MAGLVQVTLRKAGPGIFTKNAFKEATRCLSGSSCCNAKKQQYKTPPLKFKRKTAAIAATTETGKRIDSVGESLASKGFLRPRSSYAPPQNVTAQINEIYVSLKIPTEKGYELHTLEEKFAVLEACSNAFNHSVPNSMLYEIKTIDDIVAFYETPVETTTPFDVLKRIELPANLHIQHEYVRFHPDTDTKFGGKSAFPKSSTLVTGLKYRNKYPGHIAKRSWP